MAGLSGAAGWWDEHRSDPADAGRGRGTRAGRLRQGLRHRLSREGAQRRRGARSRAVARPAGPDVRVGGGLRPHRDRSGIRRSAGARRGSGNRARPHVRRRAERRTRGPDSDRAAVARTAGAARDRQRRDGRRAAPPAGRRSRHVGVRLRHSQRAHAVHGVVFRSVPARYLRAADRASRGEDAGRVPQPPARARAGRGDPPGLGASPRRAVALATDTARPAVGVPALHHRRARAAPPLYRRGRRRGRGSPMTAWPLAGLGAMLVLAPLLPGVAAKTRATLTGRRGAPVWQLYRDLRRLWRKGAVYSTTTTWIFRLAPVAGVATPMLAVLLVPLDGQAALLRFAGDFVAFAALLALGRFTLVLAALDTGSSFEGMGASRDEGFTSQVENALFLGFVVQAIGTEQSSLSGMLGGETGSSLSWGAGAPSLAMVAVSLFFVLLAEASRVPVDDPATHLELTMIHEVAVLDHSGPDLALLLYGGALRMGLFAALPVVVLVSRAGLTAPLALGAVLVGTVAVAVAVGVIEASMARLRLSRVPQFLVAASVLASLGVILQLLA